MNELKAKAYDRLVEIELLEAKKQALLKELNAVTKEVRELEAKPVEAE